MDNALTKGLVHSAEVVGTAIHTSTTRTALYTAKNISGRGLKVGQKIVIDFAFGYGITSTPNITMDIGIAAVAVITTGAVTTSAAGRVIGCAVGVVRSIGATGMIAWSLVTHSNDANLNTVLVDAAVDTVDMDTEDGIDLDVGITWSASSASNTATGEQFSVKIEPHE